MGFRAAAVPTSLSMPGILLVPMEGEVWIRLQYSAFLHCSMVASCMRDVLAAGKRILVKSSCTRPM